MSILIKYTADVRIYEMDFSALDELAEDGDTIASITSVSSSPSDVVVGSPSILTGGKVVQFELSAGTIGSHQITAVVATTDGYTLTGAGTLVVLST